jgi:hypothetical protein
MVFAQTDGWAIRISEQAGRAISTSSIKFEWPKQGYMSIKLIDWCRNTELSLLHDLEAKKVHVDATGKGAITERIVEERLINPFLPPHFRCSKGAVSSADAPDEQSPAIDRIVYDPARSPPLVFDGEHSLFPIEAIISLVEITLTLDADKLRQDIERMRPVKAMTRRRYRIPIPGSNSKSNELTQEGLSPRSFVIGMPDDKNWRASIPEEMTA